MQSRILPLEFLTIRFSAFITFTKETTPLQKQSLKVKEGNVMNAFLVFAFLIGTKILVVCLHCSELPVVAESGCTGAQGM